MAEHKVQCRRVVDAPPEVVWALLQDFCAAWHPHLEWLKPEKSGQMRVFKVKGDDTIYREKLTSFSNSDRVLRYEHVEGICDIDFYRGECRVEVNEGKSVIHWFAHFSAPEPRAAEIAEGTRLIFEAGLGALSEIFGLKDEKVIGMPLLAVSSTAKHEGPLLLFLHGIGGNRKNWRSQLYGVAPFCQAASLDLRGYGESPLGPDQSRVDDYCHDILRVMQHFVKEKVVLCGLSYGSWIATSFAMRFPDQLAGLILCGGCTGMSEAPVEERISFFKARQKPLDEGKSPKDFAQGVVDIIAGPNASGPVRQELLASMAAIPGTTYRDAVWCFTHPIERFDFTKITCPVLMMTGAHDKLASPSEIRGVVERIHAAGQSPLVQFEIISDAGHVCNLENSEQFNYHLLHFMGIHLKP